MSRLDAQGCPTYWHSPYHANNFSREVGRASHAVALAEGKLLEALKSSYPLGREVRVVHSRGSFIATVEAWDTHGCRVQVKNTVTGRTSKWWAAHVELTGGAS